MVRRAALAVFLVIGAMGCDPEPDPTRPTSSQQMRYERTNAANLAARKVDLALGQIEATLAEGRSAEAQAKLRELRKRYPVLIKDPTKLDDINRRIVDVERLRAIDEALRAAPGADQKGWRHTTWGMTPGQIRKLVPGARSEGSGTGGAELSAPSSLFGRPTSARFLFANGGLVQVEVQTLIEEGSELVELLNLLASKYGAAGNDGEYSSATTVISLRGNRGFRPWIRYRDIAASKPTLEDVVTREEKLSDL